MQTITTIFLGIIAFGVLYFVIRNIYELLMDIRQERTVEDFRHAWKETWDEIWNKP